MNAKTTHHDTPNHLKERAKAAKDELTDDVERIKAAIYDTSQEIKDQASDAINASINNMKEQSAVIKDNVADYTAQKPFKALGIALVTGLVLGYLLGRK